MIIRAEFMCDSCNDSHFKDFIVSSEALSGLEIVDRFQWRPRNPAAMLLLQGLLTSVAGLLRLAEEEEEKERPLACASAALKRQMAGMHISFARMYEKCLSVPNRQARYVGFSELLYIYACWCDGGGEEDDSGMCLLRLRNGLSIAGRRGGKDMNGDSVFLVRLSSIHSQWPKYLIPIPDADAAAAGEA